MKTKGFSMTARARSFLPKGFPADVPGTCHFLDRYEHPSVSVDKNGPEVDHIALGSPGAQRRQRTDQLKTKMHGNRGTRSKNYSSIVLLYIDYRSWI